ncbi:hypothetical protein JGI2_00240 [Candidatus Kryptobacter tengchongensis]|nr:hypothetical protein JGI2_00240 [Candidatus Kryptobacter tengchongensis]
MIRKLSIFSILSVIFILKLSAQTNADCFACHEDKTLIVEKGGRVISLYIN